MEMTLQQIIERMGSMTTEAEAEAMVEILQERGITDLEAVDQMDDKEFASLIPEAIQRAANPFMPTHVITLDNGDRTEVQLVDGAAYTRAEWYATDQADYTCQDNGEWTFQGEAFAGKVEAI